MEIGADDDLKSTMPASLRTGAGRDSCFSPPFLTSFRGREEEEKDFFSAIAAREGGKGRREFLLLFSPGEGFDKVNCKKSNLL